MLINHLIRPKTVQVRRPEYEFKEQAMPNHGFGCRCEMCKTHEEKRVSQILQARAIKINTKIAAKVKHKHGQCTSHYYWIVKHLQLPTNKIILKGIDVYIPEVLFYQEGDIAGLFCNKEIDEPFIKRVPKEKLTGIYLLKMFGDRRRKYREMVNSYLGKRRVSIKQANLSSTNGVRKQSKDGVVLKYIDGLEQLISQNQFLHISQKRKQDPFWKEIHYIKNYISTDNTQNRIFRVKFVREDIRHVQLFSRAQNLMKVQAQNIISSDPKYISNEEEAMFCKSLQSQSLVTFCEYVLMKIVNFIELFHDERIDLMSAKIYINQMGNAYLQEVTKLTKQSLVKYDWTNQIFIQKINQEEQKVFKGKTYEQKQGMENHIAQISQLMEQNFVSMRDLYGLSHVEEDNKEEIANNQFFKTLYPSLDQPITEILKNPTMTPDKFKRDFLGYKHQKKPIVRPFSSNMIRSLHSMTPQFHKAPVPNYLSIPKRTVSTAVSKQSRRRNFSLTKASATGFSTAFATTLFTPRDY